MHKSDKSNRLVKLRYLKWKKQVKELAVGRGLESCLKRVRLKKLFEQKFTPEKAVNEVDPKMKTLKRKLKSF